MCFGLALAAPKSLLNTRVTMSANETCADVISCLMELATRYIKHVITQPVGYVKFNGTLA